MTRQKHTSSFRLKLIGAALLSVLAGVALIALSRVVMSAPAEEAMATAPASAPADAPPTPSRRELANQQLGGLVLIFGAAGILLGLIFIGWIVYDIHQSRPAWKTQKKYPRHK